jgi:DNA repair exonuclease SbcCD nuclease subunit
MDDFRVWFWVIVVAIWILRSLGGKKKEKPAPRPRRATTVSEAPPRRAAQPKALTFEELLREIQAAKEKKEAPKPVVVRPASPPVVDYDEEIEDEIKGEEIESLEEVEVSRKRQEETTRIYEEAKRMAFQRPSLEETVRLGDTDTSFRHFKEYELGPQEGPLKDLVAQLRNRDSFKKAFILSEILTPKFSR